MYWELYFDDQVQAGCLLAGAPERLRNAAARDNRVLCTPYELLMAFVCAVYLAERRRILTPKRIGKAEGLVQKYLGFDGPIIPIYDTIMIRQYDGVSDRTIIALRDVLVGESVICEKCPKYTCNCNDILSP